MFRFPTAAAAKQKWPRASQWPPTGGNVRRRRFWAAAVFSFFDLVLFHLFFSLPHPLVRVLHRLVTGCFSFFFCSSDTQVPTWWDLSPTKMQKSFSHVSLMNVSLPEVYGWFSHEIPLEIVTLDTVNVLAPNGQKWRRRGRRNSIERRTGWCNCRNSVELRPK